MYFSVVWDALVTGEVLDRGRGRAQRSERGARGVAHHVEALALPPHDARGVGRGLRPCVEVLRKRRLA